MPFTANASRRITICLGSCKLDIKIDVVSIFLSFSFFTIVSCFYLTRLIWQRISEDVKFRGLKFRKIFYQRNFCEIQYLRGLIQLLKVPYHSDGQITET
jgi:hypothetical protein